MKPGAVPHLSESAVWVAETPDEERRMREAELRRRNRLAERDEIRAGREEQS